MIVPDTKDWTWVLRRACPQCGFDSTTVDRTQMATMLRDNAAVWREVLGGPDVRIRPAADTWSPLEYACHVRDVCVLFDERLVLMLTQNAPSYPNWDQDETAVAERYGEQDPARVADDLSAAAEQLAARFELVDGDQWERTGLRSDGSRFTVDSFSRYLLHDLIHHRYDVTGVQHA